MNGENYKEYIFSKKEIVCYTIIYSSVSFLSGILFFRNILFAAAALILVPFILKGKKRKLLRKRDKIIRNEFCDALQIISISLSSGKTINKAFIEAASELEILYGSRNGIIVKEFIGITKKLSINQNLKDILKDLADRTNCEEIQSFQEAEELCRVTGGNIIEIVKNTYQTILQKNEIEDDIDVICAEQKLSFKILLFIPFIILFIMSVLSADYINVVFTTRGRIFVIISLVLILTAYFIGSKILAENTDDIITASGENIKIYPQKSNGKLIDRIISRLISRLRRYTYERNFKLLFTELYDKNGDYFYEQHRKKQIYSGLIVLFMSILVFLSVKSVTEVFILFLSCEAALFIVKDRQIKEKVAKKRKAIEDQLPLFLSKLAILTDAGITIKSAIERITVKMPDSVLKRQLMYLIRDFSYGMKDEVCFENFARRCKTKGAASFSTIVLQSIRKGGRELSSILRIYAKSSWDRKKAAVKITGEEKAMKLMIPTMMIFVALMILMAAPAVINMSSF